MTTYKKIINAAPSLNKLSETELKVKQAISLSKLIKKLDNECVHYYELREKLCKKYGEFQEEKGAYFIPEENRKIVDQKMMELDDFEVDFGEKVQISLPDDSLIDAMSIILTEEFIDFIFEDGEENGK